MGLGSLRGTTGTQRANRVRSVRLIAIVARGMLAAGAMHACAPHPAADPRTQREAAHLAQLERAAYTSADPASAFHAVACEMLRIEDRYGDERAHAILDAAERAAMNPPPSRSDRARAERALAAAMLDVSCDSTGRGDLFPAHVVPPDTPASRTAERDTAGDTVPQ